MTKEMYLPVAEMRLVKRIARVLAGSGHSSNAMGSDPSAGKTVDQVWREHMDQALTILHTMREPDKLMAASGDPETWSRMVEAAICQSQP